MLIVLAARSFAMLDTATKHATALAPVVMLLWLVMLIRANMRASAPVPTPYPFSQIAFATRFGWLVSKQVPDARSWAGKGTIATSGVGNALVTSREVKRL